MKNLPPAISFQKICFAYGNETVLESFSFVAQSGRHTVIKGESGSGKSTILKLILGFLNPASGSISIGNGEPGRGIRQQTAWLPPGLNIGSGTVAEVIQKPFEFSANKERQPGKQLIRDTLETLGLKPELIHKNLQDISTGQRQRVAIALCHLLKKPLLLLDEPTSSLDEESKTKVKKLLFAQTNYTVLSTSHDPSWLETADNIVTLD